MSYTRYFRRASRAAYAMDFPRVAHIVADLDDLALGVPYRGPRRPSPWGRLTAVVRRVFAHRRLAAVSAMTAIIMAVAACGDSTEPVGPAPVAEVGVTPLAIVLEEGGALQLTAVAFDSSGQVLSGRRIEWRSDAPNIVAVSAVGRIRAVGRGYAAVTATIDGRSSSTAITVTEREPAP